LAPNEPTQAQKVNVNLPKETVPGEDGKPATRSSWARSPLDNPYQDHPVISPEVITAGVFPPDTDRHDVPYSIDVYLPGKVCFYFILYNIKVLWITSSE
jgi:hypothetical protein